MKSEFQFALNLIFEIGSVHKLNKIYSFKQLDPKLIPKVQNLIFRAYRRTRGELDEYVKNLPNSNDPSFYASLSDELFSGLDVSTAVESLRSHGIYKIPKLMPQDMVKNYTSWQTMVLQHLNRIWRPLPREVSQMIQRVLGGLTKV